MSQQLLCYVFELWSQEELVLQILAPSVEFAEKEAERIGMGEVVAGVKAKATSWTWKSKVPHGEYLFWTPKPQASSEQVVGGPKIIRPEKKS